MIKDQLLIAMVEVVVSKKKKRKNQKENQKEKKEKEKSKKKSKRNQKKRKKWLLRGVAQQSYIDYNPIGVVVVVGVE